MKLDLRSFLLGIATVLAILAVGFGGGVMMGGVVSGDPAANKLARRPVPAAPSSDGEFKPTLTPVVVAPAKPAPSETQTNASATSSSVAPETKPAAPQQQAATPATPTASLVEKPVSLTQPTDAVQPRLTPYEAARQRAQQRQEERARRHEEWRQKQEEWRQKQAEQRRQYQLRREQRTRPQPEPGDDDNAPAYAQPRGPFDGAFRPSDNRLMFLR